MKSGRVSWLVIALILAFVVSYMACSHAFPITVRERPASSPNPSITPGTDITVSQFLLGVFDPLEAWERAAALRTWNTVPSHENYEIRQNVYGEIAGAYGLALVIVDKSLASSSRFSLIVFIRRPRNKYDLYWIYKNADLSRVSLNRVSGDIFVSGIREGGSSLNCEIAWSRKDNKWTCLGL